MLIVLVAKIPRSGDHFSSSKTRLKPLLGKDVWRVARAMLIDTLDSFQKLQNAQKLLYFTPPEAEADAIQLSKGVWDTLVMPADIRVSNLSSRLNAITYSIQARNHTSIIFIGSDCPHLPPTEAATGHSIVLNGDAYICPASDGGYTLLALPTNLPMGAFDEVLWSHSNTCISQILALRRLGLVVRVGPTYYDIDNPEDLARLLRDPTHNCSCTRRVVTESKTVSI